MRRFLALAALLASVAACDPCASASRVHLDRCNEGDQASCEWLSEHIVGGSCEA